MLLWEEHIAKASLESSMIMNLRPTLYFNTSLLQKLWNGGMQVPQPHATSSRRLATTSMCYSTTVKGLPLKNFVGAAVRPRDGVISPLGSTGDKKMEMILAKVKLES